MPRTPFSPASRVPFWVPTSANTVPDTLPPVGPDAVGMRPKFCVTELPPLSCTVGSVAGSANPVGSGAATRRVNVPVEPVVRALEKLGVVRAPGETARDLAEHAIAKLGERARAFEKVVPAYYEARYGGRDLTAEERAAIREAAQALESLG